MHHFIYPNKDTWISSGSNKITGETETDQNYGKDQIIEIKNAFDTIEDCLNEQINNGEAI